MKRIKSACLLQTVQFQLKDDLPHDEAVRAVQREYERYRAMMDRKQVQYKIVNEQTLDDGTIQIELRRQYNYHDCGHYLD